MSTVGQLLDEALSAAGTGTPVGVSPDDSRLIFGQEYLYAWQMALLAKTSASVRWAGDSTTVQADLAGGDRIVNMFTSYMSGIGMPVVNTASATNGESAEHWRLNREPADRATHPTLYIVRLGINDPGYLKSGWPGGAPLDSGSAYPDRRTASDAAASLDAGLAAFRSVNPVSSSSILLMMPTSTYDEPNGRYAPYYEALLPLIKALARKHSCCFVDSYSFMRDSKLSAGLWLDNVMPGGGRGIHQKPVANAQLLSLMIEALVPVQLRASGSAALVQNVQIPLAGGWTPYNTVSHGIPWAHKNGQMTTIVGLIKGGVVTPGTVIGNIPAGYRPARSELFSGICSGGLHASFWVHPDGNIQIDSCPNNAFFSFGGISYHSPQ